MRGISISISCVSIVIITLLLFNQLISGYNLLRFEQTSWKKTVDSVLFSSVNEQVMALFTNKSIEHMRRISFSPKTYILTITEADTTYHIEIDSAESVSNVFSRALYDTFHRDVFTLSTLDSIVRKSLYSSSKSTPILLFHKDKNDIVISQFPVSDIDISELIEPIQLKLGYLSGESIVAHFDFPYNYFWEKAWKHILLIIVLFLLLLFAISIIFYMVHIQKKLSAVQDNMMQQIVHDLNTPLNTIGTLTEILKKPSSAPQSKDFDDKTDLILQKVRDLKSASRYLLGSLSELCDIKVHRSEFDLKSALEKLVDEQKWSNSEIRSLDIKLHFDVDSPVIYASQFHLTCAIRNLLDNAVKYSGGDAVIKINCSNSPNGLIISVSDNGQGIAEEHVKNIFTKYYQIKQTGTQKKKGYGLGLTYVKNVVLAHGGKIYVESTEGEGSTFFIRLKRWKKK